MKVKATVMLLLGLCLVHQKAFADDACKELLPHGLSSALTKRFRDYRPPRETDNFSEDVNWAVDHGGTGCLGIAP